VNSIWVASIWLLLALLPDGSLQGEIFNRYNKLKNSAVKS